MTSRVKLNFKVLGVQVREAITFLKHNDSQSFEHIELYLPYFVVTKLISVAKLLKPGSRA